MAATLAHAPFGLQAPTNDDTMEISSDQGNMDGDIDIDLDSAGEQMHYEDDDQMIDDDAANHPDDDLMVDDEAAGHPIDREMLDDTAVAAAATAPQEHDEELLDFSDDEDIYADEAPIEQPTMHIVEAQPQRPALVDQDLVPEPVAEQNLTAQEYLQPDNAVVEQVQSQKAAELLTEGAPVLDHTSAQHQDTRAPQVTIAPGSEHASASHAQSHPYQHGEGATVDSAVPVPEGVSQSEEPSRATVESAQAEPTSVTESVESHADTIDDSARTQTDDQPEVLSHEQPTKAAADATAEAHVPSSSHEAAALTVDTAASKVDVTDHAYPRERQPNSPTVTGLHPTVVEYDGNEIYLFPSSDPAASEQYLLGNENLVTSSLGDLLQACRSVLGQTLSEDEELVLGVEELDLYVSEDSTPAFSISFSELLDVYLQLHKHDGNDNPPPFRVTLTTKTRFTNRLNLITQAISEGKGFSQLDFLHHYDFDPAAGFPDEEEFDDDSYHEIDGSHAQDHADEEHDQSNQQHDETNPVEQQTNEEPNNEQNEEATQEYQDDSANYVSEYTAEEHEQYAKEQQEYAEAAQQSAYLEDDQDATQYYDAEGGQPDQVRDPDQQNETVATAAQESENDTYGEDALTSFYRDEDSSSLTTDTASADGNVDDDVGDDLGEAPVPPEDDQFEEDSFLEEGTSHQEKKDPQDDATTNNHVEDLAEDSIDVGRHGDAVRNDIEDAAHTGASEHKDEAQSETDNLTASVANELEYDLEEEIRDNDSSSGQEGGRASNQDSHNREHGARDDAIQKIDVKTNAIHDDDEIDFDEDDDIDEQQPAIHEVADEAESAKTSPSVKRSYSERNETGDVSQDDQALKKVRSS